jgi:hypothetical protein
MRFDVSVYDDPDDLMQLAKLDIKQQSAIG